MSTSDRECVIDDGGTCVPGAEFPLGIAESVVLGHKTRITHKSAVKKPVHPPPKQARPGGPKATDRKLTRRRTRACARCLRRHGFMLSDRLENMSRPTRRRVINMWRDYRDKLSPKTIDRVRNLLAVDDPFSPDQAYAYFARTTKKGGKKPKQKSNMVALVSGDRRYAWARRATVSFARGIQQKLAKPGVYSLGDEMLRLSNVILREMASYMHCRPPPRCCPNRKAKFMIEMADKVAVWIDEILSESDDRLLMMDFDEDDEVTGMYDGFADEFLDMMAGGKGVILIPPKPAYLKFSGPMAEAFKMLTDEMYKNQNLPLICYGKFNQNFKEAADQLRQTQSLAASDYNSVLAQQINRDLTALIKEGTPPNIANAMKDMIDLCSNYLAQNAEENKFKGPSFKFLIKKMKQKPSEGLIKNGKTQKNMGQAAQMLMEAKSLETDHDDPNISLEVYGKLEKLVANCTPYDLKNDMAATLDTCSKYVSQAIVDLNERGPAFDLLVKELEKKATDIFSTEHKHLATKQDVAYALKNAPGLSVESPDKTISKKFEQKLHSVVDGVTPKTMVREMQETVARCSDYLADYVKYRSVAIDMLSKALKKEQGKELIKRGNFKMTQGEAAAEIEASPVLAPVLPIKDIADEIKQNFNKVIDANTPGVPQAMKTAMKSVLKDAAGQMSQNVALKSGAAGDRYGHNLTAAVTKSMGDRELAKYKDLVQTYNGAGTELQYAGGQLKVPTDSTGQALQKEIIDELKATVPTRLSPAMAAALGGDMDKASKHIAASTKEKGDALDSLVADMKKKGHENLGRLQGYMQTYAEAGQRVENAGPLAADKVDKASYETANTKLKQLVADNPNAAFEAIMPEVVEDVAKFLGAPPPETPAEKKKMLNEFLARKGPEVIAEEGMYKMTYQDAAKDMLKAPVGVTRAHDDRKKKEMEKKLREGVPEDQLKDFLKEQISEGAAYVTDAAKGRGDALQAIYDDMKKEGNKKLLDIGKSVKTYEEAAEMLKNAKNFVAERAPPGAAEKAERNLRELNSKADSPLGAAHMESMQNIVAKYIAGEMAKEAGMVPGKIGEDERLAAQVAVPDKPKGGGYAAGIGPETDEERERRLAAERILGRPETPEERARRLEIEKKLGRPETEEELRARIAAEKRLGRPETDEERKQRMEIEKRLGRPETEEEFQKRKAEEDLKKYGPETDAQKQARIAAEKLLGRPETDEERKRRLEVEKRLGRPETPEEMRARLEAEKRLGRPETEEEFKARMAGKALPGGGGAGAAGGPESEAQRKARQEAEKILGRPETEEERKRRLEAEKRLGRPETPEEMKARLEAEKRLGRPETEEEFKARMAGKALPGGGGAGAAGGPESEAQRKARQEAEKILGRPETEEERKRRLEAEKRLGRPETPEEMKARLEAEKRLGRPETEEEFKARMAGKALPGGGGAGAAGGPESEAQRKARLEAEKILGRPETEEERKRRLEAEKRLGRPETPEEMRARLEAEKRLGRPETEEEFKARMAGKAGGGGPGGAGGAGAAGGVGGAGGTGGPESEAQRKARLEAEKILGRPETEEERKRRLEVEKRLGRPETPEELRARLEAEKRLGRPETEEELKARMAGKAGGGGPGGAGVAGGGGPGAAGGPGGPESDAQRNARLEAEKILGRPETEAERKRRLEIEKRLGRPETPEELRARLEAEKRLGRPETEEEYKKRMAEQSGRGPETEEEKKRRLAAENILGRPETAEERRRRLSIERRLGRPETEAEYRARIAAERLLGRAETEEERRQRLEIEKRLGRPETEEEYRKRMGAAIGSGGPDPEKEAASQLLHRQLKSKGGEIFYDQPKTKLTYAEASDWLSKEPIQVGSFVKESGDTARLAKKFERKLGGLMSLATPQHQQDVMQDVIVEAARKLAEYFVAKNYSALVTDALIAEMQKRGNEILIEENGVAETNFFAAQRLKLAKSLEAKEPCVDLAYRLKKRLDEVMKCSTMSRKLILTMKDHITEAADFLSQNVTQPHPKIEAYVALLQEMESAGDKLVVNDNLIPVTDIKKSFKDAAAYLRQLNTFEDQIRRPDSGLQSKIEDRLKQLMANVAPRGYGSSDLSSVIKDSAGLLTSYIMLQVARTEALKHMITIMYNEGDNVLLRHGSVRKSYTEGADMMRCLNTDQLNGQGADAVAARKMQIKLRNIMQCQTPDKFKTLMDDVIEDATKYLAVALLSTQTIRVCKCMKNVFVQCELWCEEILRRVSRPCCTCSRHISSQVLTDLAPATRLRISPGNSHAFAPGLDIEVTHCPSMAAAKATRDGPTSSTSCPAVQPCPGLLQQPPQRSTTSYMVHTTIRDRDNVQHDTPTRLPRASSEMCDSSNSDSLSPTHSNIASIASGAWKRTAPESATVVGESDSESYEDSETKVDGPFTQDPTVVMRATVHVSPSSGCTKRFEIRPSNDSSSSSDTPKFTSPQTSTQNIADTTFMVIQTDKQSRKCRSVYRTDRRLSPVSQASETYDSLQLSRDLYRYSPHVPSITTDQMSDWHSMMVSLMWNVQAWCDWLQAIVDRALAYSPDHPEQDFVAFQRKAVPEAMQWRQYNVFSRQLTLRLALRYRDKRIVSPVRGTNKTKIYIECQQEMLEIIYMFNKWTKWLILIIKDTDSIKQPTDGPNVSLHRLRWSHFKKHVEKNSDDWAEYNRQLKCFWDHKYNTVISEWLPSWQQPGPVWVVSACGAVPSGAVVAGEHDHETIYVARTTHMSEVVPAALVPSKQCCLVYAEGAVHHYTKYQVMCNARVSWQSWRAGGMGARAVRVSAGVHVGRVRYRDTHLIGAVRAPAHRCHVVIFGRAFAFNCYDLLVLADDSEAGPSS